MAIDTKSTFVKAFNSIGASNIDKFSDVIELSTSIARSENSSVTAAALANASGAWYAWLLAIYGENITSQLGIEKTFLKAVKIKK